MKKNILLVDDHKIIREGIRLILEKNEEYNILDASSGKKALQLIESNKIDLIISDINMDNMDGVELCEKLKESPFENKIMVLTMNKDSSLIKTMLDIGVNGYVFKDSGKDEILMGIETILNGEYYFSSDVSTKMTLLHTKENKIQKSLIQLTTREVEVLKFISDEYTNKEIADELFVSVRTVDSHRRNLIEKIGAKNTAGLVRYAFTYKLAS